jgi:integrase
VVTEHKPALCSVTTGERPRTPVAKGVGVTPLGSRAEDRGRGRWMARRVQDATPVDNFGATQVRGLDRSRLGYEWVNSKTFRKTVATRLDEAGLSARQIADHLGHSNPSMTQDVYMGRRVAGTAAAELLGRGTIPAE